MTPSGSTTDSAASPVRPVGVEPSPATPPPERAPSAKAPSAESPSAKAPSVEELVGRAVGDRPDPRPSLRTDAHWISVTPHGATLPEHDWKLRVSTRAATFPTLLNALLPVLPREGRPFKVARSTAVLARTHHGQDAPAGVGKAVTVYPDQRRVRGLGPELATLLRGHEGPRVESDLRVADDAPVSYRYGPFAARWYADERGALALRVPGPDGEFFDPVATLDHRRPPWVTDPFAAPDAPDEEQHPDTVLGGRHHVTRGIVVRDVTPRDIVLGPERAALIDFGLAAYDGLPLSGGTPGFAPTRQLRGDLPRPEDDCYALGMVLAYAATGMLPLAGVTVPGPARARTPQTVTALHGDAQPDFIALLGALLSDEPNIARDALGSLIAGDWFGREGAPRTVPPVAGGTVRVEPAFLRRLTRPRTTDLLTGTGR